MSGYDGSCESVSFAPPNLGIQAESAQQRVPADVAPLRFATRLNPTVGRGVGHRQRRGQASTGNARWRGGRAVGSRSGAAHLGAQSGPQGGSRRRGAGGCVGHGCPTCGCSRPPTRATNRGTWPVCHTSWLARLARDRRRLTPLPLCLPREICSATRAAEPRR